MPYQNEPGCQDNLEGKYQGQKTQHLLKQHPIVALKLLVRSADHPDLLNVSKPLLAWS